MCVWGGGWWEGRDNESIRITGSRFVGGNHFTQGTNCVNLYTVLYQTVEQNIVNLENASSCFVRKSQKQNKKCYLWASSLSIGKSNVPLCKPTKNNGGF